MRWAERWMCRRTASPRSLPVAPRAVTPDTAVRLASSFSTTPAFWLTLQAAHDLSVTINARVRPRAA
jgi:plasmid maintenance system antidote protein VapI